MSEVSAAVPADDPLMVAWTAYTQTPGFANTKRWAQNLNFIRDDPDRVDGSLWAAFAAGHAAAAGGAKISELERLIAAIDDLVLPHHYDTNDRYMDQVCRAGIKSVIEDRIRELRGQSTPPMSAADALVEAARMISSADVAEIRAEEAHKTGRGPSPFVKD